MIRIKDLSIGFEGKQLLSGVTTEFKDNSLTALIGRNGSGKSTLLRALAGLNESYKGEIYISDTLLSKIPKPRLSAFLAFVNTQRPRVANLRCIDVVALGRSPFTGWTGRLSATDKLAIEQALNYVSMLEYAQRELNTLSDGEFQRIMIARAIAQDTPIILLDEPTSFLDLPTRFEIVGLLKKLSSTQNKTIVFSTHELDIALEFSNYIALIENKNIVNLPPLEMIKSGNIQKLFSTPGNYIERLQKITTEGRKTPSDSSSKTPPPAPPQGEG